MDVFQKKRGGDAIHPNPLKRNHLGAQNHLPHQKILPQPFLLGIPTWLPRCLARWKSSKAPSKKKSYQPFKLMDILQMIVLMEEILHHLGHIYITWDAQIQSCRISSINRVSELLLKWCLWKLQKKMTLKFQKSSKKFSERIPDPKTTCLFFVWRRVVFVDMKKSVRLGAWKPLPLGEKKEGKTQPVRMWHGGIGFSKLHSFSWHPTKI